MGLTVLVYLPLHESKFTGVSLIGLDGKIIHRFSFWGILLTLIINRWESTYTLYAAISIATLSKWINTLLIISLTNIYKHRLAKKLMSKKLIWIASYSPTTNRKKFACVMPSYFNLTCVTISLRISLRLASRTMRTQNRTSFDSLQVLWILKLRAFVPVIWKHYHLWIVLKQVATVDFQLFCALWEIKLISSCEWA